MNSGARGLPGGGRGGERINSFRDLVSSDSSELGTVGFCSFLFRFPYIGFVLKVGHFGLEAGQLSDYGLLK